MRMSPSLALVAALVLAFSAVTPPSIALAATSLEAPRGWTTERNASSLQWQRPAQNGAKVVISFSVAEKNALALRPWFETTIAAIGRDGKITGRQGVTSEPGLLKDAFLRSSPTSTVRSFLFAWDTPQGKQSAFIIVHSDVPVSDPAVQEAIDAVATVWRQRAALSSSHLLSATSATTPRNATPQVAGPPVPAPRTAQGRNCHDVTRLRTTMQTQMQCNAFNNTCGMVTVPVSSETTMTECE